MRLRRFVHIITALFVFSYIAFDVLDLDLSDFPLKPVLHQRVVVMAEMPKAVKLTNLHERHLLRMEPLFLDPSTFKRSIRPQYNAVQRAFFRRISSPVHRRTLPRSSPESSPVA